MTKTISAAPSQAHSRKNGGIAWLKILTLIQQKGTKWRRTKILLKPSAARKIIIGRLLTLDQRSSEERKGPPLMRVEKPVRAVNSIKGRLLLRSSPRKKGGNELSIPYPTRDQRDQRDSGSSYSRGRWQERSRDELGKKDSTRTSEAAEIIDLRRIERGQSTSAIRMRTMNAHLNRHVPG